MTQITEIKVRSHKRKNKKSDVTDQGLLLMSSEDGLVSPWDSSSIFTHLVQKVGLTEEEAQKVAKKVEKQVLDLNMEVVDSELIRELVNSNLVNMGYHGKLKDLSIYQIPREFIETLMYDKSNENSNIVNNNPEAINLAIAELALKQWALDAVFSDEVKHAHDTGAIHLHYLVYPHRVYAFSGDETYIDIKYKGIPMNLPLYDLWEILFDVEEEKLNRTQYRKKVEDVEIYDRGKWVKVEQIVLSKEKKKAVKIILDDCMSQSVTNEHGVIVNRDGKYLIVRADEVKPTDLLVKVAPKDRV